MVNIGVAFLAEGGQVVEVIFFLKVYVLVGPVMDLE